MGIDGTPTLRILLEPEVTQLCGLSRVSIWRGVKSGTFPTPVQIGPRRKGWRSDEIAKWLESLPRAEFKSPFGDENKVAA